MLGGWVLSPRLAAGGPLVGRSPCLQRRGPSSRRGKPSGAKVTKAGGEGHGERGKTKAPASASPHARSDRELFPWPPNFHSSPGEGEKKKKKKQSWGFRYNRGCFPPPRRVRRPAHRWKLASVPETQSKVGPAGPTAARAKGELRPALDPEGGLPALRTRPPRPTSRGCEPGPAAGGQGPARALGRPGARVSGFPASPAVSGGAGEPAPGDRARASGGAASLRTQRSHLQGRATRAASSASLP